MAITRITNGISDEEIGTDSRKGTLLPEYAAEFRRLTGRDDEGRK